MEELMRQLAEIESAHGVPLYEKKTQALLWSLKLKQITLDEVVVTPNGWHLLRVTVEEEKPEAAPAPEPAAVAG